MKISKIIQEKLSIKIAKEPRKVLFFGIVILNVVLVFGSSAFLYFCFRDTFADTSSSFWDTVFNVFVMILDAGNISEIVGKSSNAILAIVSIIVILIGTVIFTGAIIGYFTNIISDFIVSANTGNRRLIASNHIVIINWNNRASEIVNDLLFSDRDEIVVVLVNEDKEKIEKEIQNRISDTIERERKKLNDAANELIKQGELKKRERTKYVKDNMHLDKLTVIVRQGETYSLKQLNDISILTAKCVIILGKDENEQVCKYSQEERQRMNEKGNINTIKALVQVSQLTSSEESFDNQKVVVEVEDEWTMSLVEKIIKHKQNIGKCNIVPIPINKILGQILSQFSIMPELNTVYSELFSNKGSTFYSKQFNEDNEIEYFTNYLKDHAAAIPVTVLEDEKTKTKELFYIAEKESDFSIKSSLDIKPYDAKLTVDYKFEPRHIVIIGHNSKSLDIMDGFRAFISEWDHEHKIIDVMILDEKSHLEKMNYYSDKEKYWFISNVVDADVYDRDKINDELKKYIDSHEEDTSILILSDDNVSVSDIDSTALTYLIYVQDIISEYKEKDNNFDVESIDVVVELLNPKNYDVARSYSIDNVIISNRYISRMIAQVGEKEAIYDFYKDILTYDETSIDNEDSYSSKELYLKVAERFFDETTQFPINTSPRSLVQGVYNNSPDNNKTIVLGLVKAGEQGKLFLNSDNEQITINRRDKLILFAVH